MAVTTDHKLPAAGHALAPAAGSQPDLAEVTEVLARLLTRLLVHVSGLQSRAPASFRQIVTTQLRIGTEADVDVLERYLSGG